MEGFDLDLDWVSGMNLLPRISKYSCFKLALDSFELVAAKKSLVEFELESKGFKAFKDSQERMKVSKSIYQLLSYLINKKNFAIEPAQLRKFIMESTPINEEYTEQIIEAYESTKNRQTTSQILSLGKLISFNWTIRNQIGSKNFSSLNKIFVELDFTVSKSKLTRESYSVTLTLPEFQKFTEIVKNTRALASEYSQ
mmetsp:Transcript_34198/g.39910  ORF Transcript_34198/g.39910 Transcript_34198/m.39910 type:complete len:197 (-) Transcript_34198:91-681(-)